MPQFKSRATIFILTAFLAAGLWVPRSAIPQGKISPPVETDLGTIPSVPLGPTEEEEIIVEMHFGPWLVNEGLIGILHRGGLMLPLGEVMLTLEFAVGTDPTTGQADGWFLSENRRFSLDIPRAEVFVEGRPGRFDPALMLLLPDDIYVDTTLLESWFPLDFEFDLSRLVVKVSSSERLPFEERLEREKRRARLGRGRREGPEYPKLDIPYRLFDWPVADVTYDVNYNNTSDEITNLYNTFLSGDLLFMNSRVFVGGSAREPLTDLRMDAGRRDPAGNLLGSLRATEFSLGDIFSQQIPLVSGSSLGAGVQVSTFPLFQQTEFDRTNLRGELPLGWEVELYRNEILLDSQTSRPDGLYEFLDVPLLFGSNVLRLIFYGPQGQKREKVQTFFLGQQMVRPGKQYFRAAVNRKDRNLIRTGSEGTPGEFEGDPRFTAEYERGLTRKFSFAANVASLPIVEEGRINYATLGLRAAVLGAFSRLDVTRNDLGQTAGQFATQTSLFGVNVFAEHGQFFDFVSERLADRTDPLKSESTLRLDGNIPSFWIVPRLPINITGNLDRRESGREELEVLNRLSLFLYGVSLSNSSTWFFGEGGDQPSEVRADGNLILSGRVRRLSLRGGVNYTIRPKKELTSGSITGDYDFTRNLSARATVSKQFTGEGVTRYSAGLNRRFRAVAVGVTGDYASTGDYSARLNLTFSLGVDPRKKRPFMQSDRLATTGAASARVFLDQNVNGTFDAGDEPLEGVRFRPSGEKIKTDENGVAYLYGLSSDRPTDVTIETESFEDPFWISLREGANIVPRPGRPALIDFPVVPTGEVDGTVYLVRGEAESTVSNVRMQLVDAEGKVVQEVKTAFDGFYLFTRVPPGHYTVRVSPKQAERLNLETPPEEKVEVEGTGSIVSGIDMTIRAAPKP